ncbi:MAG: DUF3164 family protein [Bacteroidales bacterium]
MENVKTVTMTTEEAEAFEVFKRSEVERREAERVRCERERYREIVDEAIGSALPRLTGLSEAIARTKSAVMGEFMAALELKGGLYGVRSDQQSHTFTNSAGTARVMIGQYYNDDYRDTVSEGIEIVKGYIESLAKDDNSRALVGAVLRLLARDAKGTLKASRVLQLRKMAEETGDVRFLEGVRIIEESYRPTASRRFIRAEIKGKDGGWVSVPLSVTDVRETAEVDKPVEV